MLVPRWREIKPYLDSWYVIFGYPLGGLDKSWVWIGTSGQQILSKCGAALVFH